MSSEVVIFTPIFYFRDRTTVARGNTEGSGQLSYTVDSVTKRDEGSYSCKVSKKEIMVSNLCIIQFLYDRC